MRRVLWGFVILTCLKWRNLGWICTAIHLILSVCRLEFYTRHQPANESALWDLLFMHFLTFWVFFLFLFFDLCINSLYLFHTSRLYFTYQVTGPPFYQRCAEIFKGAAPLALPVNAGSVLPSAGGGGWWWRCPRGKKRICLSSERSCLLTCRALFWWVCHAATFEYRFTFCFLQQFFHLRQTLGMVKYFFCQRAKSAVLDHLPWHAHRRLIDWLCNESLLQTDFWQCPKFWVAILQRDC